jgi:hypothetical protein
MAKELPKPGEGQTHQCLNDISASYVLRPCRQAQPPLLSSAAAHRNAIWLRGGIFNQVVKAVLGVLRAARCVEGKCTSSTPGLQSAISRIKVKVAVAVRSPF